MRYNTSELVDMIYILGECLKNALLASRVYAQRYPNRRHPEARVFEQVMNRFQRTGNVRYEKETRKTCISEENKMNVILSVVEDPQISCRTISNNFMMTKSTVNNILRKEKFHPYHIKLNQDLKPTDFQKRVDFCVWANNKILQDPVFMNVFLMSDEASFSSCGQVNRHNFHYYDKENPYFHRNIDHQYRQTVNVWGGIIGDYVIGPHFFDDTLTGQIYLEFLRDSLPLMLDDIPLDIRRAMWFMHDGAPVHFTRDVRNHLDQNFPERWIGRGSDVLWPPRSPDLTTCDFFLWGYVKEKVYQERFTTIENFKQSIRNAFQSITRNMLQEVRRSFRNRLNLCIEEGGQQFEHLIN